MIIDKIHDFFNSSNIANLSLKIEEDAKTIIDLQHKVKQLSTTIDELNNENSILKEQIEKLISEKYGSKSEKVIDLPNSKNVQLSLFPEKSSTISENPDINSSLPTIEKSNLEESNNSSLKTQNDEDIKKFVLLALASMDLSDVNLPSAPPSSKKRKVKAIFDSKLPVEDVIIDMDEDLKRAAIEGKILIPIEPLVKRQLVVVPKRIFIRQTTEMRYVEGTCSNLSEKQKEYDLNKNNLNPVNTVENKENIILPQPLQLLQALAVNDKNEIIIEKEQSLSNLPTTSSVIKDASLTIPPVILSIIPEFPNIPANKKLSNTFKGKDVIDDLEFQIVMALDKMEKEKNSFLGPLPNSIASPEFLADIIMNKIAYSLPVYRQHQMLKHLDVFLSRQTMTKWLLKLLEPLMPLKNLLHEKLLSSKYVQMDETFLQVLKELDRLATTKSYLWGQRTVINGNEIVVFHYNSSRGGAVALELLEGFIGTLQCDGYSGYDVVITKSGKKIIRAGCMDHARRRFFKAFKIGENKNRAELYLIQIKILYKIEFFIQDLSADIKLAIREKVSKPVMDTIKKMIDADASKYLSKSLIGDAISYMNRQWSKLSAFLKDGSVALSNILMENKMRPIAIGRKNWLFCSSPKGADLTALLYSLYLTATGNGINPYKYFVKLLKVLPSCKTVDEFESLLPLKSNAHFF